MHSVAPCRGETRVCPGLAMGPSGAREKVDLPKTRIPFKPTMQDCTSINQYDYSYADSRLSPPRCRPTATHEARVAVYKVREDFLGQYSPLLLINSIADTETNLRGHSLRRHFEAFPPSRKDDFTSGTRHSCAPRYENHHLRPAHRGHQWQKHPRL